MEQQEVITLTDKAVEAIKNFLSGEGKPDYGLRVAIIGGGCSGFQYDLSISENAVDGDIVMTHDGIRVFIDSISAPHLSGTVIDFISDIRGSGFTFNNPNAISTCGCGQSFEG